MTEKTDLDEMIIRAQERFEHWRRRQGSGRKFFAGLIIIVLAWVVSGTYMVGPGEEAVVRRFGKMIGISAPGLHYRLPSPLQTHDKVDVANVRRAEIGFRTEVSPPQTRPVLQEAMMLTGDENIVEAQLIVQYIVKDSSDFLFKVRDPVQTLRAAAEVALRGTVGKNTIDYTMTDGRVTIQGEVQSYLQALLDLYETGILVTEAKLLVVDPPGEVKESFHEVVRAWEDRERLVQEAEGYREDIIPRARGTAFATVKEAEGRKERRILEAQGDAKKFIQVLEEYSKAKEVTRQRIYLEMIEKVMPDVKKYIIEGQAGGNVLQLLPLASLGGDKN